jgi:hypothetical protein
MIRRESPGVIAGGMPMEAVPQNTIGNRWNGKWVQVLSEI